MRFLAKLLQRVPVRKGAPTLVAVLALAGILGYAGPMLRGLLEQLSGYWG